ncbi:hypothetical protein V3470_00160 [Flavobacterium oreochromis]|uniref:Uncharacterized protein n=1 Tax=Flavobacterium oreochromis TaxID=2906078 RepID=A0ABW8P6K8_9FLAO|nr:hypothetical protein [Flavobacterium oreochromis]OWP78306.1 hypothetical protein BWG23_02195 [Flavobacterium oreochromis]
MKNYTLRLKNTSEAELQRFDQFMLQILRENYERKKDEARNNILIGNHYATSISINEVIVAIRKMPKKLHKPITILSLLNIQGQYVLEPNVQRKYIDSQGNEKSGLIFLKCNNFLSLNLIKPKGDVEFNTFHNTFQLNIYEAEDFGDKALQFSTESYELFELLVAELGYSPSDTFIQSVKQKYQDKFKEAYNNPDKLDVLYETLPKITWNDISDDDLFTHLGLIVDSIYTPLINSTLAGIGNTNEEQAILNILYAYKNRKDLYDKFNGSETALLLKIYDKLIGEEQKDLMLFLYKLVEENDSSKPTDTVYFDNSYYLFRNTHLKTELNGTQIVINNYKENYVSTQQNNLRPTFQQLKNETADLTQKSYIPISYISNKSFKPLAKLNFGTKMNDDELLGDDKTFVLAIKLHNLAYGKANWDLFDIATDLLSLLSAAGMVRIIAARGVALTAKVIAGAAITKDVIHYTMLSQNTLQKWHDNGYGWLANLWMGISIGTDLLSLSLPYLSRIGKEGKAATELAETEKDITQINKIVEEANQIVKAETGKDVTKMSEKQFDKFIRKLEKNDELIDSQPKPSYKEGFKYYSARTPKASEIPVKLRRQARLLIKKVDDEIEQLYEIENTSGLSKGKKVILNKKGKAFIDHKWLNDRILVAGMIHRDKKLGEIIITKTNFPKAEMENFLRSKSWARGEVDLDGIKEIYKMFKDTKYLDYDMHPYIEKLLKSHFEEIKKGIKHPNVYVWGRTGGLPGTHAEVLALNDLLWTLEKKGVKLTDEVLKGFVGYNKKIIDQDYMIRCGDCQLILKDVLFLEKIEKYKN